MTLPSGAATYRTQRGADNLAESLKHENPEISVAKAILTGTKTAPAWAVRIRLANGDVGYARPRGKAGPLASLVV